jgi:hypothetical protein
LGGGIKRPLATVALTVPASVAAEDRKEIANLASRYDELRRTMSASFKRTQLMTQIVGHTNSFNVGDASTEITGISADSNLILGRFHRRLTADGKLPKVVTVAVMRKMITMLNAMVRDNVVWAARIGERHTVPIAR